MGFSEENKPRQFWLTKRDMGSLRAHNTLGEAEHKISYNSKYNSTETKIFHVIEFSAFQKLQQELESVKADKENLRQHLLSECRNHKATQDEFENLQREMIQVKHIHNANCDELAAEKAKANELLEALESIYNIDAKRLDQFHTPIDSLNDVYEVAEQAIAKYRQAEGQR